MYSFLLIGQSNMAGRGIIGEVLPIENENVYVLRNGRWQNMFVPINPDRAFSGINLAESFADKFCREFNVKAGLIPCADGGSSLSMWEKGSLLYDNALYLTKLAKRTSTVAGVLWHQGEADCNPLLYPQYEEKFLDIMNNLRRDLELFNVPFLIGGLGDFLSQCELDENLKNYCHINKTLKKIANENKMTAFVDAKGLGANADNLHFSSKSLREFGIRYYDEFKRLSYNLVSEENITLEDKNWMEVL